MILIGQYDSSFVRRVGIALRHYGLAFEHRPWSIIRDAGRLQEVNPLIRVPTLVLDDGDVLIESNLILDHLDGLAAPERRLAPTVEPERHRVLKVCALATGVADKGVSLFYEKALHKETSDVWEERCRSQIAATLAMLERDRASHPDGCWFGGFTHADIAVAACLRHVNEAHPGLIDWTRLPSLDDHCRRMEALPLFREISQPFDAPA